MKRRSGRRTRRAKASGWRIGMGGWLLFLVALLLPAVRVLGPYASGWECARIVQAYLWDVLGHVKDLGDAPQFVGCALSNLLALSAPLLFWKCGQHPKTMRITATLYLFSAVNAAWFMRDGLSGFHIGYFVWTLSFGLLSAGCALQSVQNRKKPVTPSTAFRPRTPEEMAAERELKEYLRFGH